MTGKQFRQMRLRMKLTQAAIAKRFCCSVQAINRWENGKTRVSGAAQGLMTILYDNEINGNKYAVRDYARRALNNPTCPD
jgi:DNA-binding transcriptional regulator YiaG